MSNLPDFERNSARFLSEVHVTSRTLEVGRLSILTSSFDKGASQIEGFSLMNVGNGVQIPYKSLSIIISYEIGTMRYTLYPKKLLFCYFLVVFYETRSGWSHVCVMYNICTCLINSVKCFQYNNMYMPYP